MELVLWLLLVQIPIFQSVLELGVNNGKAVWKQSDYRNRNEIPLPSGYAHKRHRGSHRKSVEGETFTQKRTRIPDNPVEEMDSDTQEDADFVEFERRLRNFDNLETQAEEIESFKQTQGMASKREKVPIFFQLPVGQSLPLFYSHRIDANSTQGPEKMGANLKKSTLEVPDDEYEIIIPKTDAPIHWGVELRRKDRDFISRSNLQTVPGMQITEDEIEEGLLDKSISNLARRQSSSGNQDLVEDID